MWAVVESVVGGAPAVLIARPILPYALDFAAGAMIFVVVEEIVSESQRSVFTPKKGGDIPQIVGICPRGVGHGPKESKYQMLCFQSLSCPLFGDFSMLCVTHQFFSRVGLKPAEITGNSRAELFVGV